MTVAEEAREATALGFIAIHREGVIAATTWMRDVIGAASDAAVVPLVGDIEHKRAVNADTASYGATYTYALSKRTNLNAVLTRFNNKGAGQVAPGGNGFLGGVTASAGTDSTNIAFGIRHTF